MITKSELRLGDFKIMLACKSAALAKNLEAENTKNKLLSVNIYTNTDIEAYNI